MGSRHAVAVPSNDGFSRFDSLVKTGGFSTHPTIDELLKRFRGFDWHRGPYRLVSHCFAADG